MKKAADLSFQQALAYTTRNDPDAVITVGIIRDGQASFTVYGENAQVLPEEQRLYEIGSLTKTMTAALVLRAADEGRIDLDDTIDAYLDLPGGKRYPTVQQLLTHTSGYRGWYFARPMTGNFFSGRNSFCGVTGQMVLDEAGRHDLKNDNHDFRYSNYGYAVLGLVLESVYGTDYTTLLNDYLQSGLGMTSSGIPDRSGSLQNGWDWKPGDAYLAAGAAVSDISDMLRYAGLQLEGESPFAQCHESRQIISASSKRYEALGIRMDEIGLAWITDRENGFVWHNGATGHYNCYLGFCPETKTAVVVLSNLPPNRRIPATVLGTKLLTELQ